VPIYFLVVWLAPATSVVLLIVLWTCGEVSRRQGVVLLCWLLVAGYCQFSGRSVLVTSVGRVLQTFLAIYLVLRWKLTT
jgi:hypothetical protein